MIWLPELTQLQIKTDHSAIVLELKEIEENCKGPGFWRQTAKTVTPLRHLLFVYHEVPQESTGILPFELLYERAVRGLMFILKGLWMKELEEPEVKNSYWYVFELCKKLEDTLKLVHTELQKAQNKGEHYYNCKTKIKKFVPGDKVLVLLPTDHNKLLMQRKGPFEVSAVVGLNDYKVRVKGKERVYHANLLKKYFEREDSVPVGAVAVETNANICKNKHVKSEVEEVDLVDNIDFLEIGGYVAKESVNDVAIRDNLFHEQRAEFMELANEFQSLLSEAPGTTRLAQHHIKLTSMLRLYKAFILPHFCYCSMVWHFCGKQDSDKLDLLNKRILRFIFKDFNSEYDNLRQFTYQFLWLPSSNILELSS